jgi:hypothetical protein
MTSNLYRIYQPQVNDKWQTLVTTAMLFGGPLGARNFLTTMQLSTSQTKLFPRFSYAMSTIASLLVLVALKV